MSSSPTTWEDIETRISIEYDSNKPYVNPLRIDIIEWMLEYIKNRYLIFSKKQDFNIKALLTETFEKADYNIDFLIDVIDEGQTYSFFSHYISFESIDDAVLFKLTWLWLKYIYKMNI